MAAGSPIVGAEFAGYEGFGAPPAGELLDALSPLRTDM